MGQFEVDSAFQADARSLLGLAIAILIGAVATAAGVGGGAIYIPLFNVLVGFALKPSTALSQACITAGSLAAVATNLPRTHPGVPEAPLIDFPLMLLLTPLLLVGVGIGVLLNVTLPSWLLNILLLVLLLLLLVQAVAKGRALWVQETKRAQAAAEAKNSSGDAHYPSATSADGSREALLAADQRHPTLAAAAAAAPSGLRLRRGLSYSGPRVPRGLEPDQAASFGCLEGLEGNDTPLGPSSVEAPPGVAAASGSVAVTVSTARRRATDVSWDCMEGVADVTAADVAVSCEAAALTSSGPQSAFLALASACAADDDDDDTSGAGPGPAHLGQGAAAAAAVTSPRLSPASSLAYAPSWRAFNELGGLEFDLDLEHDSDGEGLTGDGSGAVQRSRRSTRHSGFGPAAASPVSISMLPPSARILSQLLGRPLPPQLLLISPSAARTPRTSIRRRGPLTRRSSFDQSMGADLSSMDALMVEGEETRLAAGDSWLQRRSKWRSRFPQGALPHRGTSRASLLPSTASTLVGPPPPASPGAALRASGIGLTTRLRGRSSRLGDGGDADDNGSRLSEPLLSLHVDGSNREYGTVPDPRVDYGSGAGVQAGATAAATSGAAAASGPGGGGGVTAGDPYRPSSRLATLHEEADDDGVERRGKRTGRGEAGYGLVPLGPRLGPQIPFTAAPTTSTTAAQSSVLPTIQPATVRDPVRLPTSPPAVLYDKPDGSNLGEGNAAAGDVATAPIWPPIGQRGPLEVEGKRPPPYIDADKKGLGGGGWRSGGRRSGGTTTVAAVAAIRRWAKEWSTALRRIPRRFAAGLVGAWVVYLALQAARAYQRQCSPAWWALFTVQIVSMLGISVAALLMVASDLSKHAEATATATATATANPGGQNLEEGATGRVWREGTADAATSSQHQHHYQHLPLGIERGPVEGEVKVELFANEYREGGRGGVESSVGEEVEEAMRGTAALLVLQAPLGTFCATFGAGLTGGLLGLGGGMVMGPLLLQIGVHPQVTAASSGAMVLFSSSAALIQFAMLHRLNAAYAGVFGAASLAAGLLGTNAVARAVKRSGHPSLVVLALAGVMAIGAVCVAVFGLHQAASQLRTGELGFVGLCSHGGGK